MTHFHSAHEISFYPAYYFHSIYFIFAFQNIIGAIFNIMHLYERIMCTLNIYNNTITYKTIKESERKTTNLLKIIQV